MVTRPPVGPEVDSKFDRGRQTIDEYSANDDDRYSGVAGESGSNNNNHYLTRLAALVSRRCDFQAVLLGRSSETDFMSRLSVSNRLPDDSLNHTDVSKRFPDTHC